MFATTARATLILLVLGLSLSTTKAGNTDIKPPPKTMDVPSIQAPVPTVQPTPPATQPSSDAVKAIQKPSAPTAAKIPAQPTAPKPPKAVGKPAIKPGAPAMTIKPNLTKPATPPAASMQKPQLDQQQIQQIRDALSTNAIRQMEQIQQGAAVMPGRLPGGPGSREARPGDMAPEITRDKGPDVDQTIRDAMIGRGGPFNADPSTYIGPSGSSRPNLSRGGGTAVGTVGHGIGDPGLSAQKKSGNNADTNTNPVNPHLPGHTTVQDDGEGGHTTQGTHENAQGGTTTTTSTVNADGSHTDSVVARDADKNITSWTVSTTDAAGNTTSVGQEIRNYPDGSTYVVEKRNGRLHGVTVYGGQDAPDDNAVGEGSNCVGPSNWGCKGGKDDPMDMVTQPAHGDEVANIRGTSAKPNAGPAAVTNPGTHDGSSGRGGGGGTPYDPRDPEENPEGVVTGPEGPRPAPSPISDEAIDAALGVNK